ISSQHPIAPTARAGVDLEAAGTTGREILFQATSEQTTFLDERRASPILSLTSS
ncbi:hypothetical protein BDZ89DRAFT_955141, partial [Hymenopellis radicata]